MCIFQPGNLTGWGSEGVKCKGMIMVEVFVMDISRKAITKAKQSGKNYNDYNMGMVCYTMNGMQLKDNKQMHVLCGPTTVQV